MTFTVTDIIVIATLLFFILVFIFSKGKDKKIKIGNNEIAIGNAGGLPTLEPDAARLYTREAIRLTNMIGDLERRVLLSEMMKHGEEGLTTFCNTIRAEFREYIFSKNFTDEEIEQLTAENEIIVAQIYREMHGWILLAMRQNSIPRNDDDLVRYVNSKFILWDGENDNIRAQRGRNRTLHQDFLVHNAQFDKKYIDILTHMFREAARAEAVIEEQIEGIIKQRQELEVHFSNTARVKGCVGE